MDSEKETQAQAAADAAGWFLHSGGRKFGPVSSHEMAGYFTSGMVKASDTVSRPGLAEPIPAADAALLLQVPPPAPLPVATIAPSRPALPASPLPPAPAATTTTTDAPRDPALPTAPPVAATEPDVIGFTITHVGPWMSWRGITLWLAALFALQLWLIPKHTLGAEHSLGEFVGTALGRYLGIAALCFLVMGIVIRLASGRMPSSKAPLVAMTLAYAVLLGHRVMNPERIDTPLVVSTTSAPSAATSAAAATGAGAVADGPLAGAQAVASPEAQAPVEESQSQPAVSAAPSGLEQTAPLFESAPIQDTWYPVAQGLSDSRDWQGLLKHSLQWTRMQPQRSAAWAYLGIAYYQLDQSELAIEAYNHALQLHPRDYSTLANLGNVYRDLKQWQRAAENYQQAVAIHPPMPNTWNALGIVLVIVGRHEEAIEAWKMAVHIDPRFVTAWNNLGLEYYRLNRFALSAEAHSRALAIEPGNSIAKTGLVNARQR